MAINLDIFKIKHGLSAPPPVKWLQFNLCAQSHDRNKRDWESGSEAGFWVRTRRKINLFSASTQGCLKGKDAPQAVLPLPESEHFS